MMGNNILLNLGEDNAFPLLGIKGNMGKPKSENKFEMISEGMHYTQKEIE